MGDSERKSGFSGTKILSTFQVAGFLGTKVLRDVGFAERITGNLGRKRIGMWVFRNEMNQAPIILGFMKRKSGFHGT